MDEVNWTLPPELDAAMQKFYKGPEPSPEFISRLDRELRSHPPSRSSASSKNKENLMRSLRARPALAIFLAILALLFLTGIAYAIGRITGYIPGFGFTSGDPYVLTSPVQMSQNGVSIRVEQAVYDTSGLWVKLHVAGFSEGAQYTQAYILTESGERMQSQQGGSINSESSVWQLTYVFSKIDDPVRPISLMLENLDGQSVQFTFNLRPATSDEVLPALSGSALPLQGEVQDHMALVLESVAMSTNRTILQVSLHFDQPGIWLNAPWNVTMTDDDGSLYPLADISPDTMDIGKTRLYETGPLQGNERLTLALVSFPPGPTLPMLMDFSTNPAAFLFDPGTNPQVGQTWSLDETLHAGQFTLHLVGARMTSPTELVFEFEPTPNVTGVMLYSASASGASGGVPVQNSGFTASLAFASMPTTPVEIQVRSVHYGATGTWQVTWEAPAASILNFATMPPAPSPTPVIAPTLVSQDSILLEVQALAGKFGHSIVQGPAWVHVIHENITENLPANQTYPPPYYKEDAWYEIDQDGWVVRSLTTHLDGNGNVLQQVASVGNKTINFTVGDTSEYPLYQLSFDFLSRDLDSALQRNVPVLREETTCEDGSSCVLITIDEALTPPMKNPDQLISYVGHVTNVWIDLETGRQTKFQTWWRLADGSMLNDHTQRLLLLETGIAPPIEILNTLDRIQP